MEAFRKLGHARIPASVVDLNTLEVELYEIDENLARSELSPAERAAAMARRKAIYEQLHPETKHGAIGGGHSKAGTGEKAQRFTKATADATGRSERAVQLDAARGETLGQETLAKVAHTSLDKGAELDALASMPIDERGALVDRAAGGEAVSAQAVVGAAAKAGKSATVVDHFDFDGWDCTDDERALAYAFMQRAETALAAADYPEGLLTPRVLERVSTVAVAWANLSRRLHAEYKEFDGQESNPLCRTISPMA
jgi:hypothetical protein